MQIPSVTREQMTLVDKYAVELGIAIIQMMENAGRNIAVFSRQNLGIENKKIAILCGKGNNGGDGLSAARFLANWEADVTCIMAERDLNEHSNHHMKILKKINVKILWPDDDSANIIEEADLLIDALLGYNLDGDPRDNYASLIQLANANENILAVDIPTGLDADTGTPYNPCIRASWTLTLALPKKGLLEDHAKEYVGELWLCDLGIPKEVYAKLGIDVPNIFKENEIVKV